MSQSEERGLMLGLILTAAGVLAYAHSDLSGPVRSPTLNAALFYLGSMGCLAVLVSAMMKGLAPVDGALDAALAAVSVLNLITVDYGADFLSGIPTPALVVAALAVVFGLKALLSRETNSDE